MPVQYFFGDYKISKTKQHENVRGVFPPSLIAIFTMTKEVFDQMKPMLNLRPNTRFDMLQFVENGAQRVLFVDLPDGAALGNNLPVPLDVVHFFALRQAGVASIGKHCFFVAMQQRCRLNNVDHVRRSGGQIVHLTVFGIDADMRFHAEVPLVAFLRLVYVGVALVFGILGRRRRFDDCGVDDGARAHQQILLGQRRVDGDKHTLSQLVGLQQAMEFQQRHRIRCRFARQIHTDKRPHGLAIVDCIFDRFVKQADPLLDEVHAQHPRQPDWWSIAHACRADMSNNRLKFSLGHDCSISARNLSRREMRFFAANSALEKLICFRTIAVSFKLNVIGILTPKIGRLNQRFLKGLEKIRGLMACCLVGHVDLYWGWK